MKAFILTGEGIECENELQRFLAHPGLRFETSKWPVPDILSKRIDFVKDTKAGDWVFLPGGFSFSDHFGSGRLLAYQLGRAELFSKLLARGVNFFGVCNGFQVLTQAGLFGDDVHLEHNFDRKRNLAPGFKDRWVKLAGQDFLEGEDFQLQVRHGEGRLVREGSAWQPGVKAILKYRDPDFDNGSVDDVAGLARKADKSLIIGMMPHPETSPRAVDLPDTVALEPLLPQQKRAFLEDGPGLRFMKRMLSWSMERTFP